MESEDDCQRDACGRCAETWTPLVPLRPTGTRPPLFLLPALGGDIRCYDELVQRLGDDQPVYAFRPRGNDQDLPPHQSIDEMVADYASAIRELQPAGPYHLAGWSTGGIFAFALAEALERAGDKVALLALFDAPSADDFGSNRSGRRCAVPVRARELRQLLQREEVARGLRGAAGSLPADERFPKALAEARRQGTIPAETPEDYIRRLVHVGEANVRAIQDYEPRHSRRARSALCPERPKAAWPRLPGGKWPKKAITAGERSSAARSKCKRSRATTSR